MHEGEGVSSPELSTACSQPVLLLPPLPITSRIEAGACRIGGCPSPIQRSTPWSHAQAHEGVRPSAWLGNRGLDRPRRKIERQAGRVPQLRVPDPSLSLKKDPAAGSAVFGNAYPSISRPWKLSAPFRAAAGKEEAPGRGRAGCTSEPAACAEPPPEPKKTAPVVGRKHCELDTDHRG